jgi:hypothetical protein
MASFGKWLRDGGVLIEWDDESKPLWLRLLQAVPASQQAAERERYKRRPYDEEDEEEES